MSVNLKDLKRNDTVILRNGESRVVLCVNKFSDYEYDVYFKDDKSFCYGSEGKCKRFNYGEWFDIMKVVQVIDNFDKCEMVNQNWIRLSIMTKTIISLVGIVLIIEQIILLFFAMVKLMLLQV